MGPLRTEVLPFTKVPRQSRKKKADAGGVTVTAQAGRMQQHTAQGSPGKMSGVHGRWDLRASPIRSDRGYTVFIIRDSFSSCIVRLVTGRTLRSGLTVGYGVFTLYPSKPSCAMRVALAARRRGSSTRESKHKSPHATSEINPPHRH